MIEKFAKLIDVKSIVTLILTVVFAVLSVTGRLSAEQAPDGIHHRSGILFWHPKPQEGGRKP